MDAPVFVAATSELDRDFDRIDVASLRLDNFTANPILLANHDRDCPLGTWEVSVEGGQLLASPRFASTAKAQEWKTLVDEGVIRGVSVGFRPSDDSPKNAEGGRDFHGAELLEISLVTIPANPSALRVKGGNSDTAASYLHKDFAMTIQTKPTAPAPAPVTKNEAPPEEAAKDAGEAIAALTESLAALGARVDALEAALADQAKAAEEQETDDEEASEEDPTDEEKSLDVLSVLFA